MPGEAIRRCTHCATSPSHINPFSAGTVFIRHNLTSVDVRFRRIQIQTYKDGPRSKRFEIVIITLYVLLFIFFITLLYNCISLYGLQAS